MKENADIMFPLKTPYESKGAFINASGMIQDFNLQLDLAKDNPSNQELLLQIIEGSKLPMPSLDNLKEKVKKFIDETKNTHNRLLEIPEKVLKTTKNYSSVSSHLYDVDSITRRSRPLQQTKDALSQFSEDQ
jgi:NADH dehydrogenase/NADH:ubiquinone oxidoreductase subunit G